MNILLSVAFVFVLATAAFSNNAYSISSYQGWQDSFNLKDCTLAASGSNDYFILEPGYQLVLQGQDDGDDIQLTITVLNETKMVNGTETGVVEEKETENGQVVEISRNYFAVCTQTGDVFYFGEDTDMYDNDEISSHEGSWLAGEDNAMPGIVMPGKVEVGMKYYQEIAPGIAEDRAEIISLNEVLDTPAGKFQHVLKTEETTPLEQGKEYKLYAPGIGLIQDDTLKLASYVLPKVDHDSKNNRGMSDVGNMQMERKKEILAHNSGEQVHQRHMQASPASSGKYSPGLNYTLQATGVATKGMRDETRNATVTVEISVWKSTPAIVIMDVVGGTVKIGDEEYDIKIGYALYSTQYDIFRSSSLAVSGNGDVFAFSLRGMTEAELPAASGGAPVELTFDNNNEGYRNSLNGWDLALDGTLQ
jgi:hypothetical protein